MSNGRRDNSILVYLDEHNTLYCRLCSTKSARYFHKCPDHSRQCCSYSNLDKRWNEKWKFNNEIHKIIVSSETCTLCEYVENSTLDCNTCTIKKSQHNFSIEMQDIKVK